MTDAADRSNLDDASAHYGLSHAWRTGTPIDDKGRAIVALPDQSTDADPELVGKSPEQIIEILERRRAERDANPNIDKLMREAPGGRTDGGGSSGGRRRRAPAPRPDHTKQSVVEIEMRDLRPCTVAGKVSVEANEGLYGEGNPSVGEMLETIGRALSRGVRWQQIARAVERL